MNLWRSMIFKGGKRYEKDHPSQGAAECWITANMRIKHVKAATILRADSDGINAGKFFLHRIIK
jgi:hypothetical protein